MTDTAERIAKLAERLDPMPSIPGYAGRPSELAIYNQWRDRKTERIAQLAIATPGAQLGALVDLFDFALAGKGWQRSISYHAASDGETIYVAVLTRHEGEPEDPPHTIRSTDYVSDAAALLAAMEEVEI